MPMWTREMLLGVRGATGGPTDAPSLPASDSGVLRVLTCEMGRFLLIFPVQVVPTVVKNARLGETAAYGGLVAGGDGKLQSWADGEADKH
jgi:hypothetical protein